MIKNAIGPVLLCLAALGALIGLEVGAFAQTMPPDPDPSTVISQLIAALGAGQYLLVALLATAILVWLAEHYGVKLIPALGKPLAGGLLALAMAMVIPLVNLALGGKLTLTEALGALLTAFIAWGGPAKLIALFSGSSSPTPTGSAGVQL